MTWHDTMRLCRWVMSLGTSGTLFGLSPKPILDKSGAVSPFCDASGSWLPLLCTMNCTTVTEDVSNSCIHVQVERRGEHAG